MDGATIENRTRLYETKLGALHRAKARLYRACLNQNLEEAGIALGDVRQLEFEMPDYPEWPETTDELKERLTERFTSPYPEEKVPSDDWGLCHDRRDGYQV
jgi:hypothetical protein